MADYPPLIYFDDETKNELASFLDDELMRHYMERARWLNQIESYQHSYWAEPDSGVVTFPFYGASKIVVPLNAIAIEAIHARAMRSTFGLDQIVSAKAQSPAWMESAKPVEHFLNKELLDNVKIKRPVNDYFLECEKYGTGMLKAGYEKFTKTAVRYVDGKEEEFDVVVKEGATLDCVPITRFIMPFTDLDAQRSNWCGEEHSLPPFQIQQLEFNGLFYKGTFEKVRSIITQTGAYGERQLEQSQEFLERREILLPARIDFVEIWLSWNTDRNQVNKRKEIVVWYQRETRTIMGIRYNWYADLHRPYRPGVYMPVEHRWTGIGIIKQNDQMQEEITTKHRQLLDNATLANMRMIKVSKLSGIQPGEPVFPGKMWFVDDMDHIDTLQMGEVYPSGYNTEQATLVYSQQRTGVNELTLGQPQVGTPGTASDILTRIQEGSKKYEFFFGNMKDGLQLSVTDIACNVQQFGPKSIRYYEQVDDGQLVEAFFSMPSDLIRDGLLIELKLASQLENKLLDRQNFLQIGQIYQQYVSGTLELAQLMQDPNMIAAIVQRGIAGSTELMRQFLESFDLRNVEQILVAGGLAGGRGTNETGIGAGALPSTPNGMGNIPQMGSLLSGGSIQGTV